jgi:undecaprenyl diphosphate synthase
MFSIKKLLGKNEPRITNHEPRHIAFVCDGNRRWARKRGLPVEVGYKRGATLIDGLVERLLNHGVRTISFYIFSTENWNREKKEVDFLMSYLASEMPNRAKEAAKRGIRIKFVGRKTKLAPKILKMCDKIEKDTAENENGTIVFALDYSGRDEIVRAAQSAIEQGVENLDVEAFDSLLDSGDLLPIDLVVRTGGEQRISDFMLWKMAYAELIFVDEMWPQMNDKVVDRILSEYSTRQRRFGK